MAPWWRNFGIKYFGNNKGGRMHFLLKNDDILNYSYATIVLFFNCNVMQKDAHDIFLCWLLNIEPLLADYFLDKFCSVILIHVKCYLWNVMHKTNFMSNNVITPFILGIRIVFFVKFKIPSTKILSRKTKIGFSKFALQAKVSCFFKA